jgi:hypothetical protein
MDDNPGFDPNDRFSSPFIIEIGGKVIYDPDDPEVAKRASDAQGKQKVQQVLKRLREKHKKAK